jgi:hypothetical protein
VVAEVPDPAPETEPVSEPDPVEEPSIFDSLNDVDKEFLLAFLQCEGNFESVEEALDLSYTMVKSRLAALKQKLGIAGVPPSTRELNPEPAPALAVAPSRPVKPTDVFLDEAEAPIVPAPPVKPTDAFLDEAEAPIVPAPPVAHAPAKPVTVAVPAPVAEAPKANLGGFPSDILDALDAGKISYEEALDKLTSL